MLWLLNFLSSSLLSKTCHEALTQLQTLIIMKFYALCLRVSRIFANRLKPYYISYPSVLQNFVLFKRVLLRRVDSESGYWFWLMSGFQSLWDQAPQWAPRWAWRLLGIFSLSLSLCAPSPTLLVCAPALSLKKQKTKKKNPKRALFIVKSCFYLKRESWKCWRLFSLTLF